MTDHGCTDGENAVYNVSCGEGPVTKLQRVQCLIAYSNCFRKV